MQPPPDDPVLNGIVGTAFLCSLTTWFFLLAARVRGPWLRYEPRRPVPWGPVGTTIALFFVLLALATAATSMFGSAGDDVKTPAPDASETAKGLVLALGAQAVIIGAVFLLVVVVSGATKRDLGLPKSFGELGRDIFIGAIAWLAALAPVHVIQALLMYALGRQESGHELIKMVTEVKANSVILLLAGVAAVVVAPFCEEIGFRLLFQGWLEKWEDSKLGWRDPPVIEDSIVSDFPSSNDSLQAMQLAAVEAERHEVVLPPDPIIEDPSNATSFDRPSKGLGGLPYGSLPIIISSAFFALAHLGYGPEPVPLFFLALILGYVYQRTHRIVPSIVAHALFNAFTMLILWRVVFHAAK